jgi:hypothetical protein
MNRLIAIAFVSAVALFGLSPSYAMSPAPLSQPSEVTQVAGGCGSGWHRGPHGGCLRNYAPGVRHACPRGYHMAYGRCRANY